MFTRIFKRLGIVAIAITSAFLLAGTAHASDIHRITLEEDKPIIQLSQDFAIRILDAGERTTVFIEVDKAQSRDLIRALPRTDRILYELYVHNNRGFPMRTTQGQLYGFESIQKTGDGYVITTDRSDFLIDYISEQSLSVTATLSPEKPKIQSADKEVSLSSDLSLTISLDSFVQLPEHPTLRRISPVYQYDIVNFSSLNQPLHIQANYDPDYERNSKSLYYFDKNQQVWIQMESYHHVEDHYIEAESDFTYLPFAIFADDSSEDGIASWYAWKGCLCAASRDFPKGTELKVTRLKTGKSVIITVNDYGPEEWTGRTIDLDKAAFEAIGPLGAGLIYVNVEPI